ncbi:hypothetical protein MSG37_12070 [Shewanella sp. 1CM18E]|uniref:hypothetical protein n=1 Tax=Shewanella sp. 1CM18E TaxID=2929169 RepID=UPI0020BF85D8|nr:hypothetical protein [Shewanella sp. 1CM18E]MCK8045620.1 hypothetical protein [Shewanella sp. 1CM18E]
MNNVQNLKWMVLVGLALSFSSITFAAIEGEPEWEANKIPHDKLEQAAKQQRLLELKRLEEAQQRQKEQKEAKPV